MLPMSTTNTDYSLSSPPVRPSFCSSVCLSAACQLHFSHDAAFSVCFWGSFAALLCNAFCVLIYCKSRREGQLRRRLRSWQRSTCVSARVLCFICFPLILRVGGSTLTEFEVTPHTHTYTQSLLQLKVLSAACHHYQQRRQQQQQGSTIIVNKLSKFFFYALFAYSLYCSLCLLPLLLSLRTSSPALVCPLQTVAFCAFLFCAAPLFLSLCLNSVLN